MLCGSYKAVVKPHPLKKLTLFYNYNAKFKLYKLK